MAICMLHGSVGKKLLRPLAMDILALINTFFFVCLFFCTGYLYKHLHGKISGGKISANFRSKRGSEWAYIAIQEHIFKGPVRAYFGDTLCCRPRIINRIKCTTSKQPSLCIEYNALV